ncbi:MAG: cysteine-rich small domain-containing protein [Tissierellales bacterium]|jgi:Zn-finger protein|nr:cysteine-rich small domain-containing protein [Tissierellales bacterium]
MENYKFFQNNKCEFFPCHKIKNKDEFNCLFCYCPLYALGKDCGGNFKIKNGIKDCSDCLIPHTTGGYEYIMSKITLILELAKENLD